MNFFSSGTIFFTKWVGILNPVALIGGAVIFAGTSVYGLYRLAGIVKNKWNERFKKTATATTTEVESEDIRIKSEQQLQLEQALQLEKTPKSLSFLSSFVSAINPFNFTRKISSWIFGSNKPDVDSENAHQDGEEVIEEENSAAIEEHSPVVTKSVPAIDGLTAKDLSMFKLKPVNQNANETSSENKQHTASSVKAVKQATSEVEEQAHVESKKQATAEVEEQVHADAVVEKSHIDVVEQAHIEAVIEESHVELEQPHVEVEEQVHAEAVVEEPHFELEQPVVTEEQAPVVVAEAVEQPVVTEEQAPVVVVETEEQAPVVIVEVEEQPNAAVLPTLKLNTSSIPMLSQNAFDENSDHQGENSLENALSKFKNSLEDYDSEEEHSCNNSNASAIDESIIGTHLLDVIHSAAETLKQAELNNSDISQNGHLRSITEEDEEGIIATPTTPSVINIAQTHTTPIVANASKKNSGMRTAIMTKANEVKQGVTHSFSKVLGFSKQFQTNDSPSVDGQPFENESEAGTPRGSMLSSLSDKMSSGRKRLASFKSAGSSTSGSFSLGRTKSNTNTPG